MGKIGAVIMVVGFVIIVYLILLVAMPILVDTAATANATMDATSNMTNYPGTAGALVSAPWALFFVPGAIGIAAIVIILKKKP